MDEMMTIKEAAKALGVSRQHIYTLEKRGKVRIKRNAAYLRGGRVQVYRADIEKIRAEQA